MAEETIAAIATPPGAGGIGIIRLSGTKSVDVVSEIFTRNADDTEKVDSGILSETHRVIHGYIFDPSSKVVLDEVLVIPMLSPRSYTAEDVVEIHAHSGAVVLHSIMELILSRNVRLAEPGEFTRRAFLNGRIDLSQAEAVADIINARSAEALKISVSQGLGGLRKSITEARDILIDILAETEAAIDFPDDTGESRLEDKAARIESVVAACRSFIKKYQDSHFLRDGVKLSICGAPNAGKSSLMNRLLERERAIVTAFPGTTRDLIEEPVSISGVPFIITDTAGIHETEDPVEIIGIEKARANIQESDLILFMKDLSEPECQAEPKYHSDPGCHADAERPEAVYSAESIREAVDRIVPYGKKVILVLNKMDMVGREKIDIVTDNIGDIPAVVISAREGTGIDTLRQTITGMVTGEIDSSSSVVPNLRHRTALQNASGILEEAIDGIRNGMGEEMLSIDLGNALKMLGEITGESAGIDILDHIFSKFCIGK